MNILIFSWRGPGHPNAGGAELVAHEHAKSWVKAGHKVTLFTSTYPDAEKEAVVDGVNIIRRGRQNLQVHLLAFIWYMLRVRNNYDLVIDHFHGIPFFTPLYVRVKKIAVIHEVAKNVWDLNPWRPPVSLIPKYIAKPVEPLIFRYIYKNIPFMTGSKSTEEDLVEWGIKRKNITIIHHGLATPGFPARLPGKNKNKTATFLGALSRDKGILDVIKVFAEIDRKDDTWQYWIVGKGDDRILKEVAEELKRLGLIKKTKLWGFVSNTMKYKLLARSHVMINTSVYEGWGLVNIEANACMTPVVGYGVAGIRDSIINNETGILVKLGDYRNMAYEVIKLVYDTKRYQNMQNQAFKWSKKFTWAESTAKSLKYIESI